MTNKGTFNIERLKLFSNENNLLLIGGYNKVTRNTMITSICKTENCNNQFMKNFRTLINNNSFYCENCMIKIKVENRKITHLKNCGYTSNLSSQETKEKIKKTNLIRFGCEHNSQSQFIKNKKKQTMIQNYGVEYMMQSNELKEKSKKTCLEKYGVEYPKQNTEVMEKTSKLAYKLKNYTFPSGRIDKIQGCEKYGLDFLLKNENLNEDEIKTGCKNVPTIWYNDESGKKHRHYVDIFIPSQKRCIEIKSTWTAQKKQDSIYLKQNAAKELGYKYEIWVYDRKGNRVEEYL